MPTGLLSDPMLNEWILHSAVDTAVIATDLSGIVIAWNRGAERIFGWTEQDMLGQSMDRLFPVERSTSLTSGMDVFLASPTSAHDRWYVRKSGERFWSHGDINPLQDDTGATIGIVTTLRDRSDRRSIVDELTLSQQRLRLLLDSTAECLYAVDNEGCTTMCNAAFLRTMGFASEEEVLGRKLHKVIHHSHPDGSHYDVGDCPIYVGARDGSSAHVNGESFYRTDGVAIPVEYWVTPIVNDGQRMGAICTFFDVSERQDVKAALQQSDDRLRIINADVERQVAERTHERGKTWLVSPDLIGVLNAEGYFELSNPAWQTILGWSEAEISRTPFFDFLHPDDLKRNQVAFQRAIELGEPALRFENRYRHVNGGYRWLSWVAVPEGDKIYCSARDITHEKDVAKALAAQSLEVERLWATSPDLLLVLNFQGIIQRVNPAWTAILDYEPDELLGRPIFDFIFPDDLALTQQALVDAAGGPLPIVENRYIHKDGSTRWFSWVASPTTDIIYGIGRHITAEKEAEAALAQTEAVLRQSQKMEAVGQLTGGLAHDFNNLLAAILGSVEMMQEKKSRGLIGELDRYIDVAQTAAKRAASLTQRLLAFSRQQTLDPRPTDVNRLVNGMAEMIRRTIGPAIELEVVGAVGLWSTLVDPPQLENALLNLCINARDAMPDGGRVTIETANKWLDQRAAVERDLPQGQYISLCVTDNGIGMSPEVIARAFDPFFTTKPIGEGTGLGLSMIYGFARQSGGQVRVYSEVGVGTTMCLYLPRHYGESVEELVITGSQADTTDGSGKVVLVVDDEVPIRMLICEILKDAGYATIESGDSASGLLTLQSPGKIDLLITDVGLPGGMNGRQMADSARSKRKDLKVLFITGYAENAVVGNGHLEPWMQVLTKPFTISALREKIHQMMEKPFG